MSFVQSFRLAMKSLLSSKIRSILTMLGIIIGVAAVIVIVGLGNGLESYMKDSFKSFGTNILEVYVYGYGTRNATVDDLYNIVKKNKKYLADVSPVIEVSKRIKIGTDKPKFLKVKGVSETYSRMKNLKINKGRFIYYVDIIKRNNICVIGSNVQRVHFPNGAIDKVIKIGGIPYYVVGVLNSISNNEQGSDDNLIYIPYESALKLNGDRQAQSYSVSMVSDSESKQALQTLESELYNIHKDRDSYYVMSMAQMIKETSALIKVMVTILTSIAAISLIVGGIGIMNIMLVSVTERTREIGIRKALGAKHKHIMRQFVIESSTTSAVGGMFGIIVGYILSSIGGKLYNLVSGKTLHIAPNLSSVIIAFSISVAIGVIFGYLPAKKAAKLNPIDALHYD